MQETSKDGRLPKEVLEKVGLLSDITISTISSDVETYLLQNKINELDGYVYAVSRLVNHKFGLDAVKQAFQKLKMPVDPKYIRLLD